MGSSHQRSIDGYTALDASTSDIVRQTASSWTWGWWRPPGGQLAGPFRLGVGRGLARRSTDFFPRIEKSNPPPLGKNYDTKRSG
jgi:hypothetical protein